jgi:hypothetical protein
MRSSISASIRLVCRALSIATNSAHPCAKVARVAPVAAKWGRERLWSDIAWLLCRCCGDGQDGIANGIMETN